MTRYAITIDKWDTQRGRWVEAATLQSDMPPDIAKWMRRQADLIRKEPYMAPQLEGEAPLEGL